ncbi:GNAT family N-acetyltransferase [Actinoplanes auranticolor]|uniref:N-acetyltransferase n=1 Tax=Actinoplanes auranticolor TaxID=47988 RepID=A0A919SIG2_9ACTN|nr:GNAT family N-acetyltransferase [Actinoplanes auranticolor]GIM71588.1 N-acetyltransferase [Actinoplanes auranticolor]
MDVTVHDNPARHRFELLLDGEVGGFADYRDRDGAVVVVHSEVDHAHRGQGLGSVLAAQTLDALRARGAKVVPACPFFARYVADHPEYDDIIG